LENYVRNSYFSERNIQGMASEYDAQRNANISLFNSFNNRQITCGGTISGDHMTVRALVFMTAGHERHHLGTLEKRYGVSLLLTSLLFEMNNTFNYISTKIFFVLNL